MAHSPAMSAIQCATKLIVARHGEAEYEAPTWAPEGGSLTTLGRKQAADLGTSLLGAKVAHIWTSTLARAVQTGEIAAGILGTSVTTRIGLREFDIGDLAGAPLETDVCAPTYQTWLNGDLDARVPGAESGHELVARMRAVLAEIADQHPGETVVVVSHGGAIRLSLPTLCRMDAEPTRLANCATVEIEIDADDWVCRRWG